MVTLADRLADTMKAKGYSPDRIERVRSALERVDRATRPQWAAEILDGWEVPHDRA